MDALHVVVVVALVGVAWTCSPEGFREIHMDEMAFETKIIAYGVVMKKIPHEMYTNGYSVELDVKCTYKGGPIPSKITITNAGSIPGMCAEKNFTVGQEYLAFLSFQNGVYEHAYDDTKEAGAFMSELLSFCGLHIEYPSDGNNTGVCQDVQRDGCEQYEAPPSPRQPGIPAPPQPANTDITAPPQPIQQEIQALLFKNPEGSGSDEMSSTASMTYDTSSDTEMTPSNTNMTQTFSPTTSRGITMPIVTPENKGDTDDKDDNGGINYGPVNNAADTVAAVTATATVTSLLVLWTVI